jgi:RNA-directed DNA polymerase
MLEALQRGVKGGVWFSLIDKIHRPSTLLAAWIAVENNRGSAGADHETIEQFGKDISSNIERLGEELRAGTYRPRPIRRVYIDKPGSKEKRPLGIPCVRDRVVQAAMRLVIEPIFENQFVEHSYGFRPGRGCKDALRQVDWLLKCGYTHVVDADLKSYFDTIPHALLMMEVGGSIADGRVLDLIEGFLKQDILEGLSRWTPEQGCPQGAVISPLLANLYLHPVDVAMAEAGFRMIRYADDLVVMCTDAREALKALECLQHLVEAKGLGLHPKKTRVVDMSSEGAGFDFLGYRFGNGTRVPRKKSLKKFKDTIRSKTRRTDGNSLTVIIAELNPVLRGWFEYFKHSHRWTFAPIDKWVRRRLRSLLRKRIGLRGISRMGLDHQRWPNRFFRERGLFSLVDARVSLLQSSLR